MEATDPKPVRITDEKLYYGGQPSDTGSTPIYDDQPDRAAAEKMIADSRAEGWSGVTGEDETTPTPDPTSADAETVRQFLDAPVQVGRRIDELSAPQPSRHVLGESVIARSVVPRPIVNPTRQPCEHCEGTGYMPSISDLLRESASWIDDMDAVVRYFYTTMLDMARTDAEKASRDADHPDPLAVGQAAVEDLLLLFPPDLISAATGEAGSRGAAQRDKLAGRWSTCPSSTTRRTARRWNDSPTRSHRWPRATRRSPGVTARSSRPRWRSTRLPRGRCSPR